MEELVFMDVQLEPNPVKVNDSYKISVMVIEKIHGIMDTKGRYLTTADGKVIEKDG